MPGAERTAGTAGVRMAAAGLVLLALLAPLRSLWAVQVIALVLLLTLPGVLLLRALRVPGAAIAAFPPMIPCAAILVFVTSALAIDLGGPPLGIEHPLRTVPVLAALEVACVALLLVAWGARSEQTRIPWERLVPRPRECWPLLLPAVCAIGALRFSNGHGRELAVAGLAAVAFAIAGCMLRANRLSRRQLALVLYCAGLAAMWSFTLRSRFVYGFDVASEYQIASHTLSSGIWHASHPGDPYGAMLSLTILPAALKALAGVPVLGALKVVYPALLALFPVGLFALASRRLQRRWAFFAGAFVVSQSYFFAELPGIARQEIALLFVVTLLACILDRRLRGRRAWVLSALLGLGVVVSHYSSAYLLIGVLALSAVLQVAVARRRPLPAVSGSILVALAATAIGAIAWYGPVTHSTSNVSQFRADLRDHGLELLPNARAGQNLVTRFLSGNAPARVGVRRYQAATVREYHAARPYIHPLAAARLPRYAVRDASVPSGAGTGRHADDTLRGVQLVVTQLANLLLILGALALALRRRGDTLSRQLGILGVAALVLLAIVRLSGTVANAYNQERAFVQSMVPLAICMAWLLQGAGARRARLAAGLPVAAAAALLVLFAGNAGLRAVVTGEAPSFNVAARGENYDRYFVSQPELAAAAWFASAPRPGPAYADRYARLRLISQLGPSKAVLPDVLPATLDRDGWVYAGAANLAGLARAAAFSLGYVTYTWPRAFLDRYYAVVYTNGGAAVYHR